MQVILKCPLRASPSSPASPNTSWRCTARLWTGGSQLRRKSSEKRQELTQTTYDTEMYDEYEQFYILWNKYCWNVKLLSSALFHYICHLQSLTQLSRVRSQGSLHYVPHMTSNQVMTMSGVECLTWKKLFVQTVTESCLRRGSQLLLRATWILHLNSNNDGCSTLLQYFR